MKAGIFKTKSRANSLPPRIFGEQIISGGREPEGYLRGSIKKTRRSAFRFRVRDFDSKFKAQGKVTSHEETRKLDPEL